MEPEQGPGLRHGQMGCMILCRPFHTAPEHGQGLTPIVPHCSSSGSETIATFSFT